MKIVVTDHRFADLNQERRVVEAAGGALIEGQARSAADVVALAADADAILTARAPIDATVIRALERCRVIVRYGIGVDTIDIPEATRRGIRVANVPDYCLAEVADHTVALMLVLLRRLIPARQLAQAESWSIQDMPEIRRLDTLSAGLLGFGRIGKLVAERLSAFGMRILVHDPHIVPEHAEGVEFVTLAELLARADILSLHAPLTRDSRHIVGAEALAAMRPTAFLVNSSRGGLVDEQALLTALDAGTIAGAALDVVESELVATSVRRALVNHSRAFVTAHTAWLSKEARAELQRKAAETAVANLKGEPRNVVNLATLEA